MELGWAIFLCCLSFVGGFFASLELVFKKTEEVFKDEIANTKKQLDDDEKLIESLWQQLRHIDRRTKKEKEYFVAKVEELERVIKSKSI